MDDQVVDASIHKDMTNNIDVRKELQRGRKGRRNKRYIRRRILWKRGKKGMGGKGRRGLGSRLEAYVKRGGSGRTGEK